MLNLAKIYRKTLLVNCISLTVDASMCKVCAAQEGNAVQVNMVNKVEVHSVQVIICT